MAAAAEPRLSRFGTVLDGVAHLIRDRQLLVPPFQRGYAWRNEQVETFYWDLHAAYHSPEQEYFLGTVVLAPHGRGASTIIDGQQRLATVSMLLAAIRDAFLRRGDAERAAVLEADYLLGRSLRTREIEPRLLLGHADREHFRAVALERRNGLAEEDDRLDDADRVLTAFRFLTTQVEAEIHHAGDRWDEVLLHWVDFLDQAVRVIVVEVSDESDSFLIFETLNDRGIALTVADLLKNHLLGLSQGDDRSVVANWEIAIEALRVSADEETFATFLRHYWTARAGATRQRELFARIRAAIRTPSDAADFSKDLAEAAPLYAALLDADHETWTRGDDVRDEIAVIQTLAIEQSRPLLLACVRHFEDEEFTRLLRAVVGWTVRGLVVGGIGGGTTERYYGEAAAGVSDGDAADTDGVFEMLEAIVPSDEVFAAAFADKRVPRVAQARYYLLALSHAEDGAVRPAVVPRREAAESRVQPILPRRADLTNWQGFQIDHTRWVTRLGNCVLLSESSRLHRLKGDPSERVRALAAQGRPYMHELRGADAWTPAQISRRQRRMAQAALGIWPREPR